MTNAGFQQLISAEGAPDPLAHFEIYRGLAWKRSFAYLIDAIVLACLLFIAWVVFSVASVLTFGLFYPLLAVVFALIPFTYHTLLLGGPHHATLGMRLFGIEMRSLTNGSPAGGYPDTIQAAIQTALFYFTIPTTCWILALWALFDPRRRMLHDILAGTYVVNRRAARMLGT